MPTNNLNPVLEIKNVSKKYPNKFQALKNINLDLFPGTTGLIGPNGAGKSSLMRTIVTLQEPSSGQIIFQGKSIFEDPVKYKECIGYLPQEFGFYPLLNAFQTLDYFAELAGYYDTKMRKDLVGTLLEKVNLIDSGKRAVKTYSGGMKQRLGIAIALLRKPRILIVDEPTAGLDPEERNRFLEIVTQVDSQTMTLFSTHIVSDIENLCERVAIIFNGQILEYENTSDLIKKLEGKVWRCKYDENLKLEVLIKRFSSGAKIMDVYSETKPNGDFKAVDPTLEHVYFKTIISNGHVA